MAILSPLHGRPAPALPAAQPAPAPAAPPASVSHFQAGNIANWIDETLQEDDHILADDDPRAHGKRRILRQPVVNRFVHWAVALSTFSLFFSGFGQLPLYKRYMLSDVPYMAWTADYSITLYMHYVGAIVLMFALAFHAAHHGLVRRAFGFLPRRGDMHESALIIKAMVTGGPEPPSAKYLAEQRVAYGAIGITLLVIVVTGLLKVAKNIPGVGFSETSILVMTMLHNAAAILLLFLVIAHLAAFLVPANAKLLGAMFHGTVDRDYVEHRHAVWYRELVARAAAESQTVERAPAAPVASAPALAAVTPAPAAATPVSAPTPAAPTAAGSTALLDPPASHGPTLPPSEGTA